MLLVHWPGGPDQGPVKNWFRCRANLSGDSDKRCAEDCGSILDKLVTKLGEFFGTQIEPAQTNDLFKFFLIFLIDALSSCACLANHHGHNFLFQSVMIDPVFCLRLQYKMKGLT